MKNYRVTSLEKHVKVFPQFAHNEIENYNVLIEIRRKHFVL